LIVEGDGTPVDFGLRTEAAAETGSDEDLGR